MGLLEGRAAVVTGGASGIGAAIVRRFAIEGAAVAIVDLDADKGAAVAEETDSVALIADVADRAGLAAAIDEAARRLGAVHVLVNNAGAGSLKRLESYSENEWRRLVSVNLDGVFHGMQVAFPHLRAAGGGAIVNVSSVSGLAPTRGEAPYSAAKAGVIALTRSGALEWGSFGIRVNCIVPGFIRTPLTSLVLDHEPFGAAIDAATPLGRAGEADEVAAAALFLASDLASYVTGAALVVDGGACLVNAQVDSVLSELLGPDHVGPDNLGR